MAETHELRLKIDAASAKSGSREFVAAVDAVKRAVRDLERDSTGAFTTLKKNMDDIAKRGKMKVGGVDSKSISDLNAFARAQQQIITTTTASSKGIKALVDTMRGLSGAYGEARKTSEAFSSSILKVNSGLTRQIQLASQARSAVRQVGTAPVSSGASGVSSASAQDVANLAKAMASLQRTTSGATASVTATFQSATTGAAKAASAQTAYNNAASRMENLQLSSAAAMRRAEQEAARLSARLTQIGDTRGAVAVNQALNTLKSTMSNGVGSALGLRKAMDQFSASTSSAKISITQFNAAQARAASEAKTLADAQRRVANAAREVEKNMRSAAGAHNAAGQAMQRATGNMRGLENAFSGTFQAGSLFRTMLGSITFGSFASNVFSAGDALDQFRVSMEIATGSAALGLKELDYVDDVAGRLGVSLQSARDNYSKFAISANIAGVAASETQHIFEAVSTSMAVLGKSTEDQNLAFMALEQMMSKGKVSSEELRRQLGERLPGAVNMMAQALDVGVDKLQDMLKAGEINSSDALPKFADVLEKRFGPGLERASRRAGNNLEKLRNEITKFLEEVAQSGVMQEMAAQFRMLTDQLADGSGVNAAQRLGEGLASMARMGGEAVRWLADNLDGLGRVLKAIGFGIVTRQLGLLGAGLVTQTQQIAGYTAAWLSNRTATAAAAASQAAQAAALTTYTAGAAKASTATAALSVQQTNAMRAALTHRVGLTGLATAANAAAVSAGSLARGLSIVAPIAGIAITALMLIPGAMDMIGLGADNMETKVTASLARAGVAFDSFGETVRKTAGEAELSRLISDVETLAGVSQRLSGVKTAWGAMFNLTEFDSLLLAMDNIEGKAGSFENTLENMARRMSGMDTMDFAGISSGAKNAAKDIFSDIYSMYATGQGDVLEMQNKLNSAFLAFGDGGGNTDALLGVFDELLKKQAMAVQGLANTKDAMTRLYGTENEQLALEFADAAKQVLKTGEGVDDLAKKQQVLADMTPAIAADLATMRTEFDKAFASGKSPLEFQKAMQSYYGETADGIMRLREEVQAANSAIGDSSTALMDGLATTMASLQNTDLSSGFLSGFDGIDPNILVGFENLFSRFNEFQTSGTLEVSAESLQNFTNTLAASTPASEQFIASLNAQYGALSTTAQTYTQLDSIMLNLKAKFPQAASELSDLTDEILKNARGTDTGAIAYSELASQVASMPWPNEEARAAAMEMLGLASETQGAGNAASSATGQLYDAAGGTDAIAAGAAGAAAQVRALQGALASLGAVAAGVSGAARTIREDIQQQTALKSMPIMDRAAASFVYDQTKELRTARDEALAEVTSDTGGAYMAMEIKRQYDQGVAEAEARAEGIRDASTAEYNTEEWKDPKKASSGGGGGGRSGRKSGGGSAKAAELTEHEKAVKSLNDSLKEQMETIQKDRVEMELLASGQYKTSEAAKLMAEAMLVGGGAVDAQTTAMIKQIDVAAALNEELQKVAKDPVKEWMNSVPNWIEAGQQIEMGAIGHLKGAISELITTGTVDIASLGEAILGTIADIVSDKAMAELANIMGRGEADSTGLGGMLGGLFSSKGDAPIAGEGAGVAEGGAQAGQTISQAMIAAGDQVSQSLSSAMMQGGQQAGQQVQTGVVVGGQQAASASTSAGIQNASQMRTATTTSGQQHATDVRSAINQAGQQHAQAVGMASIGSGGGMGGGILDSVGGVGGLVSMALGAFSEGGVSTSPVGMSSMPMSAFKNAPHYSQGTSNTSGIPAVLHPNEAVIPLSKGRKIPVDMGDSAGGSSNTVVQNWNISTPDADSFRKSQKQLTAGGASAAQRAMSSNR